MKRDIEKILKFKRATGLENRRQLSLYQISSNHLDCLIKEMEKQGLYFWRPYFYVSIYTMLEAEIKYKCRIILEISGNNQKIFR